MHGATLSIAEQLGLAATLVHSKFFFILSERTQNIEGFFLSSKKWSYAKTSHLRFKSLRFLIVSLSHWPEVIEAFYTQNLCSNILICLGDLAWTKPRPGKTSCCWKWPVEVFSSGVWLWLCHHIWIWERSVSDNSRTFLAVCVQGLSSSSPGLTWCHSWEHQGQPQRGWAAVCQQGLALLCLPRTWNRLGRSALSAKCLWAKECSHSQEGESHCVAEAIPSWRQALILLLISESTAGILYQCWVLRINRDSGKLERVCQRGKKWFRGSAKSSWGIWAAPASSASWSVTRAHGHRWQFGWFRVDTRK